MYSGQATRTAQSHGTTVFAVLQFVGALLIFVE